MKFAPKALTRRANVASISELSREFLLRVSVLGEMARAWTEEKVVKMVKRKVIIVVKCIVRLEG